jgi:hypothetical protein
VHPDTIGLGDAQADAPVTVKAAIPNEGAKELEQWLGGQLPVRQVCPTQVGKVLDLNHTVTRSELGDGTPLKCSMAGGIGPSTHAPRSPDEDHMIPGRSQQTVLGLDAVDGRRTGRPCSEYEMNTKASAGLRPHMITELDLGD